MSRGCANRFRRSYRRRSNKKGSCVYALVIFFCFSLLELLNGFCFLRLEVLNGFCFLRLEVLNGGCFSLLEVLNGGCHATYVVLADEGVFESYMIARPLGARRPWCLSAGIKGHFWGEKKGNRWLAPMSSRGSPGVRPSCTGVDRRQRSGSVQSGVTPSATENAGGPM